MAKAKLPEPDFVYDPVKDKGHAPVKSTPGLDIAFQPNAKDTTPQPTHMSSNFSDLQKPAKPRWRKVMRVLLIILGVLALIAGAIALYLYLTAGKISTNPFGFGKLKGEADGRVNILLMGVGDSGHAGETLADTNMVVSINTKTQPYQVAMISLPRDLEVDIPGAGENKLNYANAYGEMQNPPDGVGITKQTVEDTLGIPIHYYIKGDFTGLKQAVDAVGGIDINVKEALIDPEYPCEKNENRSCGLKIMPGQQHMDGATALKYARCRKGTCGDDFGRAQRQQEVLTAIREKALSGQTLSNPAKITALINAAGNNVKTDLSLSNIQRLQEITKDINIADMVNVVFSVKPNGFLVASNSSTNLLPAGGNFDDIQNFVANIFELGPIWKEDSTLTVLNGTTTAGLSTKFKTSLTKDGIPITISSVGNAPTKDRTTTVIVDYTVGKKSKTAAYLSKLLGVEVTQPTTPIKNPAVDFEITLGSDYANKVSSSSSQTN